jgi:hypothetical protein
MLFLKKTVLLILFIFPVFIYSQVEEGKVESYSSMLDSKEKTFQLLSEMQLNEKKDIALHKLKKTSEVIILQIGNFNYVNANLTAKSANLVISQIGNDNNIEIDKQANSINQRIVQEGQNNRIMDYALYSNNDVNMELIQQGDNQSIQSFGVNSISKNMKVTQTGYGASVIILNK